MLKGDLATTPFGAVISDLDAPDQIGCLHVDGPDGDEALVYFKSGTIYSVFLPGRRPQLGARLISSGALAPEALEEALEAQATELQGWRLGELLVHLGFVEAEVVQAFSVEQVRDGCFELSRWSAGKWKFRKNEKTREDIAAPVEIAAVLDEILRREHEWAILVEVIGGTDSVPTLGAGGLASGEMALNQDEWALLCKVDGERNMHQLARDCGFTDFEAGQIVSSLVMTGLLEIEGAAAEAATGSESEDDEPAPLPPRSAAERLMAAFASNDGGGEADVDDETDFATDLTSDSDDELAMPSYINSLVLPLSADAVDVIDEDAVGSELTRLLSTRDEADVLGDIDFEESFAAEQLPAQASNGTAAYTSYALPPIDPEAFTDDEPEEAAAFAGAGSGDPDANLPRYSVGFGQRTKFDESLSAVSDALSALLGNQPDADSGTSMFDRAFAPADESAEEERARVIREAAAAEMSAAHAEMEEQRRRFDDARHRAEQAAEEEEAAERAREATQRDAEEARRAVEQEAARMLAEQETARLLAVEEAARFQAEQDAARAAAQAAELDAARAEEEEIRRTLAAQAAQEAARLVAEENARVAAEDAARLAEQEEAARRADEAAAAAAVAAAAAAEEARAAEAAQREADEAAQLAEETARLAEDALRAAAASELELIELDEPPPPPPAPAPPAMPVPTVAPAMTDTASLMRELSSLGFDDEPAPAPAPSRPSTPVGASARQSAAQADKGKKRKGLFGRG